MSFFTLMQLPFSPVFVFALTQDDLQFNKASTSCVGEWADSLTNISVGDLLSEAPDMEDANCITSSIHGSSNYIHQIPFSCDSFDAAIAAHIKKHQSIADSQTALPSQLSSIWGAEDTCDAFAFQRHSFSEKVQNASKHNSSETCKQITLSNTTALGTSVEVYFNIMLPASLHGW